MDSREHKEICYKLDKQSKLLEQEPDAHAAILCLVKNNTDKTNALTDRFDNFEEKMQPLLNVIDGLVILGEIGSSSAVKGIKTLLAFITGVGIIFAAAWYAASNYVLEK